MKIFSKFLWIILVGFSLNIQAQSHLGLNAIYSKPLGGLDKEVTNGYGGNLNTKFFVGPRVSLGLSVAYMHYGTNASNVNYNILPLTLESEFYFREEGLRPYLAFSGGMLILSRKERFDFGTTSRSEGYFTFSPMAGVLYDLSRSAALRFNMQYFLFFVENETWSALSPTLGIYYKIGE